MAERSGRCLCGAVAFRVTDEPLAVRLCWCRDCQHIAGNATVNMIVPLAALHVSGMLAEHAKIAASGNTITRQFCPVCGAHLFASSDARPELRVVRVGNLDDPSSVRPTTHIWTHSAPEWACLDPTLESVDAQPTAPSPPSSQ